MSRRTATHARAVALSVILGWAWVSPTPAWAQVGSLIVTVTSPTSGSTVGGTIPVNASVTIVGSLTVQRVQFQLDGANLGAADTAAPYSVSWDTFPASNGSHTLKALAQDVLGVWWSSDAVTVTVFNDHTAPTVSITSPSAGATVSGTITVSASASDNVGVAGVQFQLDGANLGAEDTTAPYSVTWNTATASIGAHTLRAVARDAAGNTATSASVSVTVPDTTAPTVSITSPSSGATVSGTITVSASASDNVGVAGVQFQLDGANLGAEDTTAPYSVTWNTATASIGAHTLRAVARDAA
ncbi:MAG TPA: Ig-like domain-containing protein, partial [Vicinamibacteria bacterium]